IITKFHNRSIDTHRPTDWADMSCCLPRQTCQGGRKTWRHIREKGDKAGTPEVAILNIYGIQTALGNADFHKESYRTCRLESQEGPCA
ncbi:hypothetical protein B484DRAFT_412025, partial [Ochromonadaceae sp. CCMP2298]